MEKLKSKTFYTILILLSLFLAIIVFLFNFQNYNREVMFIKEKLLRMDKFVLPKEEIHPFDKPVEEAFNNKLVMDYQVYTLLLDDNKIIDVINHGEDKLSNIDEIGIAFINKNKSSGLYIGNLYIDKYSYNYKSNEYLMILDNSIVQNRLLSNLTVSLITLLIFEIIIFFVSKILSNFITKPALESYNKQKEFIMDASHELKTPLSIIMASADALENDKYEKKWLDNIKSESERMNKLVVSLLDLSRLDAKQNKEMYISTSISKIIEKSALTFESIAYESNIKIETNIESEIKLNCNSAEITELMSILLDNAIKHSKKKSKIIINLYKQKKEIVIEVINKGDEIPKEECDKIFERFYRLDKSRNRDSNRYGLGLSIAKTIVLNHGGSISASSNDGFTTFKVIFKEC